jgi:SP family general alpha glucoside:H+ symporter-like MFS transporter
MVGMVGAIFIPVFSTSLPMLFAGELVCGIPWGIFRKLSYTGVSDFDRDPVYRICC